MAIRIVLVMVFLAAVLGGIFGWKQHMATQMAAARSGGPPPPVIAAAGATWAPPWPSSIRS